MKTSDNVDKIIPAFIAFQADMPSVPKDATNPHFKSKYATLGAITEATRPHLAKHGLGYTQFMSNKDGYQLIVTRIMHTSGQWMEDDGYILNPTKNDPQGMGSAVTYARRYTLGASLGIITEVRLRLYGVPLLLQPAAGGKTLLPTDDTLLTEGDHLLMCGQDITRARQRHSVTDDSTLAYLLLDNKAGKRAPWPAVHSPAR